MFLKGTYSSIYTPEEMETVMFTQHCSNVDAFISITALLIFTKRRSVRILKGDVLSQHWKKKGLNIFAARTFLTFAMLVIISKLCIKSKLFSWKHKFIYRFHVTEKCSL